MSAIKYKLQYCEEAPKERPGSDHDVTYIYKEIWNIVLDRALK